MRLLRLFHAFLAQRRWTRATFALWVTGLTAALATTLSTGTFQDWTFGTMSVCFGSYLFLTVRDFRAWKKVQP